MIISVASGKGGTGKTTVAVALALSLSEENPVQFLDCDVEEPDAHLFLQPEIKRSFPVEVPIPEILEGRCIHCGLCSQFCAYKALAVLKDKVMIFPELCHSCGGCQLICPEQAVKEVGQRVGVAEYGSAGKIQFIQGKLDIGQARPTPLISEIKKQIIPNNLVLIDSPPGTSCPVVEAVRDSHFTLLVTEPTPLGLNDLKLSVEVLRQLEIPMGVIINRAGLGADNLIEDYCRQENIPVLMNIPFDREIARAYSQGKPLTVALPQYREKFKKLLSAIKELAR